MKIIFTTLGALLLLLSCSSSEKGNIVEQDAAAPETEAVAKTAEKDAVKEAEEKVYNFYFTPSVREDLLRTNAVKIATFLSEETGMKFLPVIPEGYNEVIKDFGNKKADIAMINSFGYIIASEKFQAHAKLRSVRQGKSTYKGQIIVHKGAGINSLKDIHNKKIAFTNKTSTSGYLLPNQMLSKEGVRPQQEIFAQKHHEVVELVYSGKADAGATFYSPPGENGELNDARAQLLTKYPDIAEKVLILTLTDPIPNDPIVFNDNFPEDKIHKVVLALRKFIISPEGKSIFFEMYGIEDFVKCTDNDYDLLKDAVAVGVKDFDAYLN